MNRASDAEAARFGYTAGREAGWRDAVGALATVMIERGHSVALIAPILRDLKEVR